MNKEKEDVRMRGQDEEVRVADDRLHEDGGHLDTPDAGADTGQRSGVTSLQTHPRNPENGGQGKGQAVGGPPQREFIDYRPISDHRIIAQKEKIDEMNRQIDQEISVLKGMIAMDVDKNNISVDLDRMMYRVPKPDVADPDE